MASLNGQKRIARVGNKFYDLGTSNKSFLKLALTYRKLGIKNWYFPLEICDPSLVTINPYAADKDTGLTTLSKDQVARVANEVIRNPWYYLREISRIPAAGGTSVPYLANRGNIAQAYCIIKGYDSWLCLPRQKGKTQSAIAIQVWIYNFGTTNSQFIFVHKDGEGAKNNLVRMRDQIDLLPEYLRCDSIVDNETGSRIKAKKNATSIKNPINNNSVITKSKATSYDMALSLARGLTSPIQYFDEPEFTNHIKTIISNSVSSFEQAAKIARQNHSIAARIFTCTPGDLDTSQGKESQEVLDCTAPWTEKVYDWDDDQVKAYFNAQGEECNHIFYIEYSWTQIGETRERFREVAAKIQDPLTVRRELLLQRLHGSSASPFPQEDIEAIIETEKEPKDKLWLLEYFHFDIYKALNKNTPYIVGVDCSTGTAGDNNAITIIDPYTIEPVAEFECSYIGEKQYVALMIELITKHIPKAVLCIERNSIGDAIIDFLLDSKIRNNLYFDKAKNLQEERIKEKTEVSSILKQQAKQKTYYGVYTGGESRSQMMAILARHVNEYKDKFVTHNIIRDISRLVRTSSGKIEAGSGFHDDSIMSYLIGMYVYYHGNNLPAFGIIKGLKDEDIKNEGLKRSDEIDPSLVNPALIREVKKQEEFEKQSSYNDILRKAIQQSQKESLEMQESGLSNNELYNNTPDTIINDFEEGQIDLDFFDTLNGITEQDKFNNGFNRRF